MSEEILSPEQVLDLYWIKGRYPIDPITIAKNADIELELVDTQKDKNISGEFIPSEDGHRPIIFFNREEPFLRIRFTIAHELGHCFLGHGQRRRDPSQNFNIKNYDPVEVAANKFAAKLLMPEAYVKAVYWNKDVTKISDLAKAFEVSTFAMRIRLIEIGLLR